VLTPAQTIKNEVFKILANSFFFTSLKIFYSFLFQKRLARIR